MSSIKELLEKGDLTGAVSAATDAVRDNPTDVPRRLTLFELLCLNGEWDRAEKQLDVVGHASAESAVGVQLYKNNLKAEKHRLQVFNAERRPNFLAPPPAYIEDLLAALKRLKEGSLQEVRGLLDKVEEARPPVAGSTGGIDFDDFRDYDDFVAPILEVFNQGVYAWVPVEQIKSLEILQPKKLRDMIWAPVRIEAGDGTVGEVFIPSRYHASEQHADPLVRLGRMTDWKQLDFDVVAGIGLRTFLFGDEERSIFELERVDFLKEDDGQAADDQEEDGQNEA